MKTNTEDVVKNVESKNLESTSNEQRQTVKPIVISRRRLLRAGAAGIPMVLTMAGVAPGQSIMGQASAASGLVYGGTGVGVRDSFEGKDGILRDNLVWSNNNGFVYTNTNPPVLYTEAVQATVGFDPTSINDLTFTYSPDEGDPVSVYITITPKINTLNFVAFLHKSCSLYTDLLIYTENAGTTTSQTIQEYFSNIGNVFGFKISGVDVTVNGTPEISNFTISCSPVTGYNHGSNNENDTLNYYPLSAGVQITFTLQLSDLTYTNSNSNNMYTASAPQSFDITITLPSKSYS